MSDPEVPTLADAARAVLDWCDTAPHGHPAPLDQLRAALGQREPDTPAPTCDGGFMWPHPFEPGVDIDDPENPDPTWCNVCGETRSDDSVRTYEQFERRYLPETVAKRERENETAEEAGRRIAREALAKASPATPEREPDTAALADVTDGRCDYCGTELRRMFDPSSEVYVWACDPCGRILEPCDHTPIESVPATPEGGELLEGLDALLERAESDPISLSDSDVARLASALRSQRQTVQQHDEAAAEVYDKWVRAERELAKERERSAEWKQIAAANRAGTVKVTDGMLDDWVAALRGGNAVQFGHPEANGLADAIDSLRRELAEVRDTPRGEVLDVVFDGPPGPTAGRFVEVENTSGAGVRAGEWIDRGDGMWALRLVVVRAAEDKETPNG